MSRKLPGTMSILGGMLTAAHADTWAFTDTLRPNGHERSMAAKRADGLKMRRGTRRTFLQRSDCAQYAAMHARARLGAPSHHF
jgi:hypothetical protein